MFYTDVWKIKSLGMYGWTEAEIKTFPHAVVQAYFEGENGDWIPVRAEIDSGADMTVLPMSIASQLKAYSTPQATIVKQVAEGSQVTGYQFMAKAAIKTSNGESKPFMDQVLSLPGNVTPLLGRTSLLDNFKVVLGKDQFEVYPY